MKLYYIVLYIILVCFPVFVWNQNNAHWDIFLPNALKQVGVKYKYGGNTPRTGFDCSGLTEYLFSKVHIKLPRTTTALLKVGKPIKSFKELKKGDLIFFNPDNKIPTHVGIYLGDGIIIHAPSSGKSVTILKVFEHIYWKNKIHSIRRVVKDNFF